jgi:predicted nuclease of restriction endonuclease-like (RecB) superfamily
MNTKKKKIRSATDYAAFLEQLKNKVQQAQLKASLAVNSELIQLYWDIGKSIVEKQEQEGWKAQIIEKLCKDLQNAFPGIQGFSRTNIFRMRSFYLVYARIPQAVGLLNELPISKIPWGHNVLLIEKIKDLQERLWYAQQVIENGLSRASLEAWIKSKAYKRHGKAITNFADKLPEPQSRLAQEVLKDPYDFDFLRLDANYRELDLEQGLIDNIQKLLLELGKGFAFIGRQYHLEIEGEDYYLDLLFYHIKLRCFCVVELKNTKFKPEYAGKLNFYISAVDDLLKHKDDNPSIGILLCNDERKLTIEYALRDINKPIGVSGYLIKIVESLPKKLQSSLPTIEDIEAELTPALQKKPKKTAVKQRTSKKVHR